MKSNIFCISFIPSDGKGGSGGDTRFFEIIKQWIFSEHLNPTLVTNTSGYKLSKDFDLKCKIVCYPFQLSKSPVINNLKLILSSTINVLKLKIKKNDFIYTSSDHLYDCLPAAIISLIFRSRWIAVNHWIEDYPWINNRGQTPFLHRYTYWIQRVLARKLMYFFAYKIIAISRLTHERTLNKMPRRANSTFIGFCGVEDLRQHQFVDTRKTIDGLFLKRLSPGKGVNDLIPIWKIVVNHSSNSKLTIAGDGHPGIIDKLNSEIKSNQLEKNVSLIGPVNDRIQIYQMIKNSKLLILPTYEENWAIVIGEALNIGTPVISYDLPELVDVWGTNVEWVPKGDIKTFGLKIIELLEDEHKYNNYVLAGNKFCQSLYWEKIADQEQEIILG